MFKIGDEVTVTMPSGVKRDGVVIHDPDQNFRDDDGNLIPTPDRIRVKIPYGFCSPTRDRVQAK